MLLGLKQAINSPTLTVGYMTSMVSKVMATIQTIKYWWEEQMWYASEERRDLAHHRLTLHDKVMRDGSGKSPYFDN